MTVMYSWRRWSAAKTLGVVPLCLGLLLAAPAGEATASECPAARVVEKAADSFMAAARSGSAAAYTRAISRHASLSSLAIFALGPFRDAVDDGKRDEYVRLTGTYLGRVVSQYGDRLQGKLVVEGCVDQEGATLVRSHLGDADITWRVKGKRISDV
jgi:hypothetical protein